MLYYKINIDNKTTFAPETINISIQFFQVLPSSENWGLYQNNYPRLVCILALNTTKEAIS